MTTFVLVHGGGHGGWCYSKLSALLRAADHVVYAPSLTGSGDRKHLVDKDVDLETHITDIVNLLDYEDLTDIVLVGHSYGGMVITGVADRGSDRIGHLVYLDAANPVNGESLADLAESIMTLTRSQGRVVDGVELVMWPMPGAAQFYGVTDPEDGAWVDAKLTPQPWKCFEQKLQLTNEDALWAIPQTHIICAATVIGRDMPRVNALAQGRVFQIDTGHDLMITEPRQVADILLRIPQA